MRKIALSFFIILFGLSVALLIFLVDIRFFAGNPQNLKDMFDKSNMYSLVSGNLRDNFVTDNNIAIDQGQSMEIISETINDNAVKYIAEDAIDQLYLALEERSPKVINLDFQLLYDSIASQTGVELQQDTIDQKQITLDLTKQPSRWIVSNFDFALYFAIICCALFLLLIILIARSAKTRLIAVSISLGITLLLIAAITIALYLLPGKIAQLNLIGQTSLDIRIQNGLNKVILYSTQTLTKYFAIEVIALAIAEAVMLYFISSTKKPKIEILSFK